MARSSRDERSLSAQQRAAKITLLLAAGNELTTACIAGHTGLSRVGAWLMMDKLAGVLPLVFVHGKWRLLRDDD